MKHLLLMLALMAPQMVMARLGETMEQCDKRYGDVVSQQEIQGLDTKAYKNGAYFMMASFVDGKCCFLVIQTSDAGSLTMDIARAIVKNNIPSAAFLGTNDAGTAWVAKDVGVGMLQRMPSQSGKLGYRLTLFNDVYVKAKAGETGDSIQKRVDALGF